MREQILNYLNQAVGMYNEINLIHVGKLPQNILDGSKHTIESDIPRHLNNFISIINMVEQNQTYPIIKNIQEGIELFGNSKLETSIQNATKDTNVVAIGGNNNQMSAKQIMEYSLDAVKSGVELLQLQIAVAKLSN